MKKKYKNWMLIGAAGICVLVIIYTAFTIYTLSDMTKQAKWVYNSPYTVSKEASAMRTRLSEMRTYLPSILATDYDDPDVMINLLEERNKVQDESIAIIKERYLGEPQDIIDLETSLAELREARITAVEYYKGHATLAEVMDYVEREVNPYNDQVDEVLQEIIKTVDTRMENTINLAVKAGYRAIITSGILCLVIIAILIYSRWNERRKNREIEYRDKLFNLLSINIDDVFFVFNHEKDELEFVSENSRRVTGIDHKDFYDDNKALYQKMAPEEIEKLENLFSDGPLHTNAECDLQVFIDNRMRDLKLRIYPIYEKKRLQRYIVALLDQTEEKEHQQILHDALISAQKANAAKQNFLSRISHEIRTPMNAIIGMVTIAMSHINERERVRDCLEKITYSSKHLLSLINDVLDMSKIEQGRLAINHEAFDFKKLIESITAITYSQTQDKKQNFEVSLSGVTEETLIGDAMRLNQVLLNLLSNAMKFTPEEGEIRLEIRQLRIKRNKVYMRFVIRDTGIGMSEEFLKRLYKPFEQADSSISQKYGGTGLGMSITKNLVSMMEGTISVQSVEGKGTAFTVELPFELHKESSSAGRGELDPLSILVVDDDRDSCEHASLLLNKFGMHTDWVLTGWEAVHKVVKAHEEGQDYDVCFIDWRMPEMDGIETTRKIREHVGADTLIIIISAYDWSVIEKRARDAGANAFISKPFFASSLYNTLLSVTQHINNKPEPVINKEDYDFSGKKVLLAEDNALNMEIAVEILKTTGMEVDCVHDGRQALDTFINSQSDEYDAVLMDIQMPVMNGYESARKIRISAHPQAKTIPIIAMTANALDEDVAAALEAGMNGHLPKPIDVDVLYRTLAKCMK